MTAIQLKPLVMLSAALPIQVHLCLLGADKRSSDAHNDHYCIWLVAKASCQIDRQIIEVRNILQILAQQHTDREGGYHPLGVEITDLNSSIMHLCNMLFSR